jgi:hypothetical protein
VFTGNGIAKVVNVMDFLLTVVYVIGGVWAVLRFLRRNEQGLNPVYMSTTIVKLFGCLVVFACWPVIVVISTTLGLIKSINENQQQE